MSLALSDAFYIKTVALTVFEISIFFVNKKSYTKSEGTFGLRFFSTYFDKKKIFFEKFLQNLHTFGL